MKKNLKIVVLGGGLSSERNVSLVTSVSVCRALRSIGYRAVFVDLFLGIENYPGKLEDLFDLPDGRCDTVTIGRTAPKRADVLRQRKYRNPSRIGRNVLELCAVADGVFLGLHGQDGEDGKIQSVLELLGIPYTGSSPFGSAMALNKKTSRLIMQKNGIPCAPETTQAPCVVKCANGGSSIGTYVCETDAELQKALLDVQRYHDDVLIEKKIVGMELTVPVLDDHALCPIEIVPPESGKFDYVAKYQNGKDGATEICPARLSEKKTKEVQALAEKLHHALKLSVYSRTDFIMDENGVFQCLEINTLPGMTPNSLLPKAAKCAGIEYADLCERILQLSFKERAFYAETYMA
ncbi:MAG: D-alanine--D-alanine ligase [Victivallaceae bacterium]|nr:D-alanine--D-alanine ligase [Victivallaceae bacterium]